MQDYEAFRQGLISRLTSKIVSDGRVIEEIGVPINPNLNRPQMVPVKFVDGTYGVYGLGQWEGQLLSPENEEMSDIIRNSTKMPEVGITSHCYSITAFPARDDGKKAKITIGYNADTGMEGIKYEAL